jgi:adenine-specific DNA methylase
MLFTEYEYFDYKFPEPQYLGAKYTHLSWLNEFIPKDIDTAFDAFSGSHSVAFLFKQLGLTTITNDFLNFNNQIGLALIENRKEILTPDDIAMLLNERGGNSEFTLFQNLYTNVFFEREEAVFLDCFRANIELLNNKYKRALAFSIINRSMTRKVTMGHFCHTQALNYAKDPARIKRNRSLIRPLREIFTELAPLYNNAVFDNNKMNRSYNRNTLDLLPELQDIDLVYFDPPYCNSHADYQSFYHLLETFTEYWTDKSFINGIKRYSPQRFSGFDKKKEILDSLEKLFELSKNIPFWLISYNNRSYPGIEDLIALVSRFRKVKVHTKTYLNGRGGKGSVAGSKEILLECNSF